ncbi:MAG: hypothetical protein QOD86_1959, partial [Miltoncostaeaceae bacterium]|nr:hypothetical protein [Miltoncostaeaceae bacterium]
RYATAAAVLEDLERLADALAVGEPAALGEPDVRLRRVLVPPAFVGRAEELAILQGLVARARDAAGGLVLIESRSGGGKTRLLDELARRVSGEGVRILRGQGVNESAQRPFQVLVGVGRQLVEAAGAEPELGEALRAAMGTHAEAACAALPDVAAILPAPSTGLGPEAFGTARSNAALARLIDAAGADGRPTAVVLDDCQWADESTIDLLLAWQARREGREGRGNVLVAVAFRAEEVGAEHPLRRLEPLVHLDLPPLSRDDLGLMLASMAGELPEQAVDVVERLAEGNPFMASAVLRGLVESGALVDEADGWRVEALALHDVSSSGEAAAFLARRMELLPERSLRLLTVGAVLGKEFDAGVAAALAGQEAAETDAALEEARGRNIVWAAEGGGRWAFVHDKLRESLLARLDPGERRALHSRAADRIEARDQERVFELAYHFDAADRPDRGLPYALAAAERARGQHALEVAERHYRIAARGVGDDADPAVRLRIGQGLGEVLMLRGRYDESREELEGARRLADRPTAVAEVGTKLGELAFKRGDVTLAAQELETALRALGRRVPSSGLAFLAVALFEVVVQVLHSLLPRLFVGRRQLDGAADELAAIRIYSRLAYCYWFKRGAIPTLWAHLREMNLAERYPPTAELAQAYSEHAPVMTMIPLFGRGMRYAERSLAIRRTLGDLWGQGQSLHFLGTGLYGAGRFEECIDSCRSAVRLLERTGDRWEVNTANWHIAFCHLRLGNLAEAVTMAQHVHEAGAAIGDHQASGISLGAWGKASAGRVPAKLLAAEIERLGDDVHTAAEVLQAEGARLLRQGRPGEAAQVLADAQRRVRAAGLRQEYVAPVPCWLATARRQEAEACSPLDPALRRKLLRAARRAARRALHTAWCYRNNLPHAHREAGLVAAMQGRTARARRHLDRSLSRAERQGQRHEAALTRVARGRLALAQRWPGAAEEAAAAERAVEAAQAAVAQVSPAEGEAFSGDARFDAILDVGRRIASALSPEAVFAAAEDAGRRLVGGSRCRVADPDADGADGLRDDAGEPDAACRELMDRALASGRPAIARRSEPDGPGTALCAPIFVRGQAAACLFVGRDHPEDPFTAGEVHLAEFVAVLAGAALENAAGFGEIQALSRSLERRVEERTTELAASNVELDASLRKAEALLDSLSEGVVACDSEGRLTLFNRASREFHGTLEPLTPEHWAGHYDLYLADGETRMPTEAIPLMRALRGESVRDVEMVIRPAGRPRRVLVASGQQIVDRNGELLGAVVAMHDITDRKRAQLALEEATRHLESILGAAGEGICGLDPDGTITYANPAAARLTGYSVDELTGRRLDRLLRRSEEPAGPDDEPVFWRKDGTSFAVEEVRTGTEEAGGTGVIVFRDVSERRGLERMKDEFVALASHELRTPLTSVLGYLEVVMEGQGGALNARQEHLLGVADRNAKRLARLVNDVLTVAQSDAGRLALDLQEVDLAALVAECAEGTRPAAHERGIVLVREVDQTLPVWGDRARLAQVLDNLVSNALKFTPPGGRVEVRARAGDGRITLEVSDTGIGIPGSEQQRLFSRFYRASSAVAAAIPGTGLGLAITKMIVERHRGTVSVESREGSGSTFRVVLPVGRPAPEAIGALGDHGDARWRPGDQGFSS